MKTIFAAALFIALATSARAEPCAKLDFAELDSLPKEQLLQMRCEYRNIMIDPKNMQAGRLGIEVSNRCAAETERMDRLLARKYQLKNIGDPSAPYYMEVSAMCRKS